MKTALTLSLAMLVSSCLLDYPLAVGDYDDMYATRSYTWNGGWQWRQDPYLSPFWGYPYYHPYFNYPRRDVIVVVPKQDHVSPREYRAPQQRPQIQGLRRGSRQQ